MSIFSSLPSLAPLTLTLPSTSTPIFQVSQYIHHLTTTPVHPVYFPYLKFGAIHAVRVTLVWAGITANSRKADGKRRGVAENARVGRIQDLAGYLTMAWGGGTLVSLLLGHPPTWLVSPTPWIVYPTIYLFLVPTGISNYIIDNSPPLLLNVAGSCVDGLTRGTTLASIPDLVAQSKSLGGDGNVWTYGLLSGLAITGGGLITGLLSMAGPDWTLGVPPLLKGTGGILGTMDAWGAVSVGMIYLALTRRVKEVSPLSDVLEKVLPGELRLKGTPFIIDSQVSRAICVILFAGMLVSRAVIVAWQTERRSVPVALEKKVDLFIEEEKEEEVVKSSYRSSLDETVTGRSSPRKSQRVRSRANTPAK